MVRSRHNCFGISGRRCNDNYFMMSVESFSSATKSKWNEARNSIAINIVNSIEEVSIGASLYCVKGEASLDLDLGTGTISLHVTRRCQGALST